jgi:hypothetical protein
MAKIRSQEVKNQRICFLSDARDLINFARLLCYIEKKVCPFAGTMERRVKK